MSSVAKIGFIEWNYGNKTLDNIIILLTASLWTLYKLFKIIIIICIYWLYAIKYCPIVNPDSDFNVYFDKSLIQGELLCIYASLPYVKASQMYSLSLPNAANFAFSFHYFLIFTMLMYIPSKFIVLCWIFTYLCFANKNPTWY